MTEFSNPFAIVDAATVSDDPLLIPANVYEFVIEKSELGPAKNNPDKIQLFISYYLPAVNRRQPEWKTWPQIDKKTGPTDEELKDLTWLKQRLAQLGIPEQNMGTFTPESLVGREGAIKISHNTYTDKDGNKVTRSRVDEVSVRSKK